MQFARMLNSPSLCACSRIVGTVAFIMSHVPRTSTPDAIPFRYADFRQRPADEVGKDRRIIDQNVGAAELLEGLCNTGSAADLRPSVTHVFPFL